MTPDLLPWVMGPPRSSNETFFICDGLDNLWTSDEHVRCLVDHDDKISNGWTVYGPPAQGP
ncbi:MAG: hypothetical protein Ct9H90mP16_13410 [Candidatus Poseidoniales archaeon]|nr:MAG: hypothetical protein Ct9H90mP16_13410 [Candidatus Poseidoniales archaeon]